MPTPRSRIKQVAARPQWLIAHHRQVRSPAAHEEITDLLSNYEVNATATRVKVYATRAKRPGYEFLLWTYLLLLIWRLHIEGDFSPAPITPAVAEWPVRSSTSLPSGARPKVSQREQNPAALQGLFAAD